MAVENTVVWTTAEVVEVDEVATGVRRVVLSPQEPMHARPGTHVDLRLDPSLDGTERTLTRSYSVVRSEDGGRRITLSVQLAPTSRGGSRRVHALAVGDRIAVTSPLQNFPLGVGAARYVLLAGGIGITAVIAMAETLRARGADYRFVVVGRSRDVLPYLDDLAATHGDRLIVHIDAEGDRLDIDTLVREIAEDPLAGRTELYMCGPVPMMEAVRRSWEGAGLSRPNLRFETFGNSGSWEPEEFLVRVPALDAEVRVPSDATVLEALEDAGLAVMSDCRKGECGLCAVRVLGVEGRVDHRDVFFDDEQKASDRQMCICVSRVAVPPIPEQADRGGSGVLSLELP